MISSIMDNFGKDEPHPPLEQEFKILVDQKSPPQGLVQFDRVVIPSFSLSVLYLITRLLAQSVCLDYYEEDLREILARDCPRLRAASFNDRCAVHYPQLMALCAQ